MAMGNQSSIGFNFIKYYLMIRSTSGWLLSFDLISHKKASVTSVKLFTLNFERLGDDFRNHSSTHLPLAGRVVYHICLKMPCVNQGGVDVGQFDS